MTGPSVLTIGHSTHSVEHWLGLLARHGVTAIADVRSAPCSRLHPGFNREALKATLQTAGVAYVFLGRELGARPSDPSLYEDGRIQYRRLAQTMAFRNGLDRVVEGASRYRIALLCAEQDPIACHRAILVSRELESGGATVWHILKNGDLESHADAMERCCRELRLRSGGLFDDPVARLEEAYRQQERKIAYVNEKLRASAS